MVVKRDTRDVLRDVCDDVSVNATLVRCPRTPQTLRQLVANVIGLVFSFPAILQARAVGFLLWLEILNIKKGSSFI